MNISQYMSTAVNSCKIFAVAVNIFHKPCFPLQIKISDIRKGQVGLNETYCVVFEENMAPLVLHKKQRSHPK